MELNKVVISCVVFVVLFVSIKCKDDGYSLNEEILVGIKEKPLSDDRNVKWSRANRRWMKPQTRAQRGNEWLRERKEAQRRANKITHDELEDISPFVSKEYHAYVPCSTCMLPIQQHLHNMNNVIKQILAENDVLRSQVTDGNERLILVLDAAERMETEFQSWRQSLRFPGLSPIDSPSVANIADSTNHDVRIYRDCQDTYNNGRRRPGVYTLQAVGSPYQVNAFCNDGWTLIQRRYDESEDFYRYHAEYKKGFGSLAGEFWLGLENLHEMTKLTNYTLRVDVTDFHDKIYYAVYGGFYIDTESNEYALRIGRMLIATEDKDGLKELNNIGFSTRDRDNDKWRHGHCARHYKTGWWSTNCGSDLNRRYMRWSNLVVKTAMMRMKPTQDITDNDLLPVMQ